MKPEIIARYRTLCRLAVTGVGGEQTNAQAAKARMEATYPGIAAAAAAQEAAESSGPYTGPPPPPPHPDIRPGDPTVPFAGWDWTRAFQTFAGVMGTVQSVTQQVAAASRARQLADRVEIEARFLDFDFQAGALGGAHAGKIQWSARIDAALFFHQIQSMNEAQREQFARDVGNRIVGSILASMQE